MCNLVITVLIQYYLDYLCSVTKENVLLVSQKFIFPEQFLQRP